MEGKENVNVVNQIRRKSRVYTEKADRAILERINAMQNDDDVAMLDEHNNVVIITSMSENEFRDFLVSGDRPPRLNDEIRKTIHFDNQYVSTTFFGSPSIAGMWFKTFRSADKKTVYSTTLERAEKQHDQLMTFYNI